MRGGIAERKRRKGGDDHVGGGLKMGLIESMDWCDPSEGRRSITGYHFRLGRCGGRWAVVRSSGEMLLTAFQVIFLIQTYSHFW